MKLHEDAIELKARVLRELPEDQWPSLRWECGILIRQEIILHSIFGDEHYEGDPEFERMKPLIETNFMQFCGIDGAWVSAIPERVARLYCGDKLVGEISVEVVEG